MILQVSDPVGSGLVASLAHPGGNITGLTDYGVDLTWKYVELVHTVVPNAARIGVLMSDSPIHPPTVTAIQNAAKSIGLTILPEIEFLHNLGCSGTLIGPLKRLPLEFRIAGGLTQLRWWLRPSQQRAGHRNWSWLVGDFARERAFVEFRARGWLHRHAADRFAAADVLMVTKLGECCGELKAKKTPREMNTRIAAWPGRAATVGLRS